MPLHVIDQHEACAERGFTCGEVQYPVLWDRTFLTGNLEGIKITMKTTFATHEAAERFRAAIEKTPVTRECTGKRNSVLDSNARIL